MSNHSLSSNTDTWLAATKILDTIFFSCALIAITFNLLNVWAILSTKLHLKLTYRLVGSLLISDSLIALTFGISFVSSSYLLGEPKQVADIVAYNMYHVGSMACVLTLTAISADLFVQNILPFKYGNLNRFFNVVFFISWLLPILLTGTVQIGVTLFHKLDNETFLVTYFRIRDNTLGYINFSLAVICLIFITISYAKTLNSVFKLLRRAPVEGLSSKKSTITIFVIIATYILFYLPSWIVGILFVVHYRFHILVLDGLTMGQRHFITAMFAGLKVFNSVSDPLIYAFRISVIREKYKKILSAFKCSCSPGSRSKLNE